MNTPISVPKNLPLQCEKEAYLEGYAVGYSIDGEVDENPYPRGGRRPRARLQRQAWTRGWMDGGEAWINDHSPSDCLTTSLLP
jgi:hypothetical protein